MSTMFVYAQNKDSIPAIDDTYITVNTLSLLRNDVPRFRMGYIQKLTEKTSLGLDLGYFRENLNNYTFFEFRPQLYFFNKPKKEGSIIFYNAVELVYINYSVDDLYATNDSIEEDFSVSSAGLDKQQIGAHYIHGVFVNRRKIIGFNLYAGVGACYVKEEFSNVRRYNYDYSLTTPGSIDVDNWFLSITAGIKLSFRLKKKR